MNPQELFQVPTLEALLAGVCGGGGLALLIASLIGFKPKEPSLRQAQAGEWLRKAGQRLAIAILVAVVVGLITGWPVAGVGVAVLVFFWSQLFGGLSHERLGMQRVEALAMWTESLRDTIAGAVGLEQAIPASARTAGPLLRPHLDALMDRLRGRMPLSEALHLLADDIDDPSADIIIAALILNSRLRGPGLREVLGALAKSAREEVDMRNRVMAQRAGMRRAVQIIVVAVTVVVVGMAVLDRKYVAPYGTPVGQLVLALVMLLFAGGFFWLRKLSEVKTPERFLMRVR
ncbi:type II secretion system F family protein [Actinospica acidithermotolerans]|uniref:type II secretion system F family protein n=1 Tax=Actinospica acidithermotolerans TaxID=2828514 RepID=UPI0027DDF0A8|nr:type II secretion system F family protein [Actinospica acidithermotolerans]